MALPFNDIDPVRKTYFINESERSVDPADDAGKVVQLEGDGFVSEAFINFERSILQNSSPSVESSQTTIQSSGATTSHPITMPSGIAAGDLLLVCFTTGEITTTHTPSAGWVLLNSQVTGSHRGSIYAKVATGSDTLTITTSSGSESAAIAYRISEVYPSSSVANIVSILGNTTTTLPVLEPSIGIRNYLWVSFFSASNNAVATVAPSGFSDLISVRSGAGAGTARAMTASAIKKARAIFVGGGTFTVTGGTGQKTFTLAIRPNLINSKWEL